MLYEGVQDETFSEERTLERLNRFLPHQAPLKDFIHHNTLEAFSALPFEKAIAMASKLFGYKTSLNIAEYRKLYENHLIREDILEQVIIRRKGKGEADLWIHKLFHKQYRNSIRP